MSIPAMLVTLAEARLHLRSSTTVDDSDVTLKILAASTLVIQYIDQGMLAFKNTAGAFISPFVASNGDFIPPAAIKAAVLLMVGYLYDQRDEDSTSEFADGRLPRPVRSLLNGYRYLPL